MFNRLLPSPPHFNKRRCASTSKKIRTRLGQALFARDTLPHAISIVTLGASTSSGDAQLPLLQSESENGSGSPLRSRVQASIGPRPQRVLNPRIQLGPETRTHEALGSETQVDTGVFECRTHGVQGSGVPKKWVTFVLWLQ